MSDHGTLFEEALGAWKTCRGITVAELDNIPPDKLDYRPAPESRSLAELVIHIIDSGRAFAGEVARPDGDLTRKPPPELYAEYASGATTADGKAALIERLRATGDEMDRLLRAAGADHMLGVIQGIFGQPVTRFAMLHFAIEHESYHRGQLAVCAREMGRVPALTQMLEASAT